MVSYVCECPEAIREQCGYTIWEQSGNALGERWKHVGSKLEATRKHFEPGANPKQSRRDLAILCAGY